MSALDRYSRLTVRITEEKVRYPTRDGGCGYQYFVRCDEIPGCCGHGATVSEALEDFDNVASLWHSWFDDLGLIQIHHRQKQRL